MGPANSRPRRNPAMLALVLAASLSSACFGQRSCGLDARNTRGVALPSFPADAMPRALALQINRSYGLLPPQHHGEAELSFVGTVLAEARRAPNACAEALAEFRLGGIESALHLGEALPHYTRAEELLRTTGTPLSLAIVRERIAVTQQMLGHIDFLQKAAPGVEGEFRAAGDPASAIKLHSIALQYSDKGGTPAEQLELLHQLDSVHTDNVLAVRGYVEWETGLALRRTGRFGEILGHFDAALAAFATCHCQAQTHAAVLLNMAAAYDSSGDAETVLRYAKQADDIYVAEGAQSLRPQSMRLIAAAYAHRKDWPKAIEEYNAAVALARQEHAEFALPTILIEMAAAQGDSGHPQEGLQTLALPMPRLTPSQSCSLIASRSVLEEQADLREPALAHGKKTLAECKQIMQPASYAQAALHLAKTQLRSGQTAEGVTTARAAVSIIESQRPRVRMSDRALIEFNEHQTYAYSVLINALLQAGKPEDALVASEQLRARAFIDLASTQPGTQSGAAPEHRGPPATRGAAAPELHSETRPFALSMDDIRRTVDAQHSTLISYWLDDAVVHAWVLAPGKPLVEREIPVASQHLATLVRATLPGDSYTVTRGGPQVRTRGGESQRVATGTRKPWHDLYKLLIQPIRADLPTDEGSLLTIVPQGPLFQLAFPALLADDNSYLIEKYSLTTSPSVGVLQVAAKNDNAAAGAPQHYLVVANPSQFPSVKGTPLPPLPGTEAEARGIEKHLGDKVTLLEGRDAGLDSLRLALPGNTVFHFATHAIVSDAEPSSSFLALDTHQGNGMLTEPSVYNMHLKASLVVLSACRTGRGRITGDGVMGLSRAFLYAGAGSVVTTLWDVVDSPTARLMSDFYGSLATGTARSTALRQAQLSLIHDLRAGKVRVPTLTGIAIRLPESPAYWAAFSLSGEP